MPGPLIGALDQGTTSTRFMIFDRAGKVVSLAQEEHRQIFPRPGWVEHDPVEIIDKVRQVIRAALGTAGITASGLAAVGVTNQRETTVVWERKTGRPVHNAIVWQDTRTAELCQRLGGAGGIDRFRAETGLPLATYFSGPKIAWLLEHDPGLRARAEKGELCFGTIDSWVVWNLTGGRHVTDVTNASRTMLMELRALRWSDDICAAMGVPAALLPEIVPSSARIAQGIGELEGVPISGILGDQHAALFGQTCFDPGSAKNTYGTGCFMLLNTGEEVIASKSGLLTTVAYRLGNEHPVYALE
ncbi:MAG: FGGY family carbohydrate kinase, partial [Acidimicrobiia bacterium]